MALNYFTIHITSVPSKFSPPAKMPEIVGTFLTRCENAENFLIFFVRFQCDLQKKKKGHRADEGIFFSDFMLISVPYKRKKVRKV